MITFNRRIFYPILYALFKLQSNSLLFDSKRWSGESCHVQPSAISIPKEIRRSIRDTPPKNRGCTWILFCQNGTVRRRCHHPCLIITDTRRIQKPPGGAGIGTSPQSAPRPAPHEKKENSENSEFNLNFGGQGRDRTGDTRIFSPLLYQLSYLATGLRVTMVGAQGFEPWTQ